MKTFDELLNGILTDYRNLGGSVSAESLIRASCQASALWGAYKAIERTKLQIFADTCDEESLYHHGGVMALDPIPGESADDYRARLLELIRNPPAGGNKNDYEKWAKSISGCAAAFCFPTAQGLGTADVVVVADKDLTGDEIPSSSARTGIVDAITAGKLQDSTAAFLTGHAVAVGDIVENPAANKSTTVTGVDSGVQLSLADDIFKFAGETYLIHCQTGTSTAANAGKLVDGAGAFTDGTYTVKKGDVVENVTDGTETTVVSVDSASQLTLADDIFTAIGKVYVVRGLIGRVKKYIDSVRPVTARRIYVLPPTIIVQDVTIAVSGAAVNRLQIAADIEAYLAAFEPTQKLYLAQLTALAVQNGAEDIAFTTPAATVNPANYQMIRPGAVTVN